MNFSKLLNLILEKNRHTAGLKPNSEAKRQGRAENVNIVSLKKYTPSTAPKDKPLLKGWKLYEAEVESAEKTEGRTHKLYVALDSNNNVRDVYCSCADFQFLWRYALSKGDMASKETYPEYDGIETNSPYTGDPSNETNPSYSKKLCKHLIKVFDDLNI